MRSRARPRERLPLLAAIGLCSATVGAQGYDLVIPVTRQAVTKNLHALPAARLVGSRRRAGQRQRLWKLNTRRLHEARQCLDRISEQWDDALGRLKAFVEG